MKLALSLLALLSFSAIAMSPTKKEVIEETKSTETSTIKPTANGTETTLKIESSRKKFKAKQSLEKDIQEAETLEQKDESSAD